MVVPNVTVVNTVVTEPPAVTTSVVPSETVLTGASAVTTAVAVVNTLTTDAGAVTVIVLVTLPVAILEQAEEIFDAGHPERTAGVVDAARL